MPLKPVILPTPSEELEWLKIREGLKRCIEAVAPTARVYERWPLKFEVSETAELLMSENDNGRIHSWIIGISQAVPKNDRSGTGNGLILWDLTVRIWGFIGYEYGIDSDNPQNELENECRKIVQVIEKNRLDLNMETSGALKEVGMLEFRDIDTKGFGQDTIIVAEGEIEITTKEVL